MVMFPIDNLSLLPVMHLKTVTKQYFIHSTARTGTQHVLEWVSGMSVPWKLPILSFSMLGSSKP